MTITPDLSQAQSFVEIICDGTPETYQWFYDAKNPTEEDRRRHPAKNATSSFDNIKENLSYLNQNGYGIYLMLNEGDGRGRSTGNVVRVRGFCVDTDGADPEPLFNAPLEAHVVTETSPGRYQFFWLIQNCPLEKFEAVQVSLAEKYGCDKTVHDLPRVFRIPGFYHCKGEPVLSRLHSTNPSLHYTYELFITAFSLESAVENYKKYSDTQGGNTKLSPLSTLLESKIKEGDRHATMMQYAGHYAREGLGYDEILAILQRIDREAFASPKNDVIEQKRIATYAVKKREEWLERHNDIDISELLKKHEIKIKKIARSTVRTLPEYLLSPPGLVGDTMQYILRTSTKPQPELALAASLCAVGALVGRKVRSPSNLRTNIYCISLIETGAGKDWPRQAIKKIFHAAGAGLKASVEELASDAAIVEALQITPSQVFLLDEIGRFMKLAASLSAPPHLSSIFSMLMKAFSSANSIWYAKNYADRQHNRKIIQPNLCLLGTTVEENFFASITKDAVLDGLLNRLLVFRSDDPDPEIKEVTDTDPPDDLVGSYRLWEGEINPGGNLAASSADAEPEPMIVPFFKNSRDIFNAFESDLLKVRNSLRKEGTNYAGLFTRAREHAIKIALILAAGQNPIDPRITSEEAHFACELVSIQSHNLLEMVRRHVSDSGVEKNRNKLLEIIRRAGRRGITGKGLCRAARFLKAKERGELLAELESAGEIKTKKLSGGPGGNVYFLNDEIEDFEEGD